MLTHQHLFEVLDKQNQIRNFLTGTDPANFDQTFQRGGVYMKMRPDCFNTDRSQTVVLSGPEVELNYKKNDDQRIDDYLFYNYPVYENDAGSGLERWKPQTGDVVDISILQNRDPQKKCKDTCGARGCLSIRNPDSATQ